LFHLAQRGGVTLLLLRQPPLVAGDRLLVARLELLADALRLGARRLDLLPGRGVVFLPAAALLFEPAGGVLLSRPVSPLPLPPRPVSLFPLRVQRLALRLGPSVRRFQLGRAGEQIFRRPRRLAALRLGLRVGRAQRVQFGAQAGQVPLVAGRQGAHFLPQRVK